MQKLKAQSRLYRHGYCDGYAAALDDMYMLIFADQLSPYAAWDACENHGVGLRHWRDAGPELAPGVDVRLKEFIWQKEHLPPDLEPGD